MLCKGGNQTSETWHFPQNERAEGLQLRRYNSVLQILFASMLYNKVFVKYSSFPWGKSPWETAEMMLMIEWRNGYAVWVLEVQFTPFLPEMTVCWMEIVVEASRKTFQADYTHNSVECYALGVIKHQKPDIFHKMKGHKAFSWGDTNSMVQLHFASMLYNKVFVKYSSFPWGKSQWETAEMMLMTIRKKK